MSMINTLVRVTDTALAHLPSTATVEAMPRFAVRRATGEANAYVHHAGEHAATLGRMAALDGEAGAAAVLENFATRLGVSVDRHTPASFDQARTVVQQVRDELDALVGTDVARFLA